MLNLESLQIFCDLVETGSFSQAAERNFISQSAVSQRMRALERALSRGLIERSAGRGPTGPTEAGRLLYVGAKGVLREAQTLEAQLRGLSDDVAGAIRVATVYSVGLHALPPRLKPFLAAHPQVNVHLEYRQTDKVYMDVMSNAVDVGIVACPTPKRGIEIIPFGDDEMVLICAPEHSLAQEKSVALRQLDGIEFIGFDADIPTRKLVDERLRATGAKVRLVNTFDNIETIKNLVEIGSGVSIVPRDSARQEERAGTLVAVPFNPTDAFRRPTGLLVKKSHARRAAVRALVEALRLR